MALWSGLLVNGYLLIGVYPFTFLPCHHPYLSHDRIRHVIIFQSDISSSGSSILGKTTVDNINAHALKDDLFVYISDTSIINVWDFANDSSTCWESTNDELEGCTQVLSVTLKCIG